MQVQYAIDTLSMDSALAAADTAVEAGINCLEAGHVLVKAVGIGIVSILRNRYPEVEIVADMKTMDMGRDEVAIAGDAGADLVIVCAAASDGVLAAAHSEARSRQMDLLVSLMGVRERPRRAQAILNLGLSRVIAHRGIDDGYHWSDPGPRGQLMELAALPDVQLALAGGINARSAAEFSSLPLERFIVGRGISDSADPAREIRALLQAASEHAGKHETGVSE
jgi:3-keto-L-gulonate-6-phosphate decarboxylase